MVSLSKVFSKAFWSFSIFKSSNVIKNCEGGRLTCFSFLFCSRLCNIVRLMLC